MSELSSALWVAWLFYWFSAAYLGTFSAILTAWGVRAIYRRVSLHLLLRKINKEQK